MLDLSHLTEEEQEMIMAVIKRDSELKKSEEGRIKHLQKVVPEEDRRKYMTGEWFYEMKSQRHQDKIHGSEIIMASMKQQKPTLNDYLTRSWGERTSSFNTNNSDGISDKPKESRISSGTSGALYERLNRGMRSPSKPRDNPFNSIPVELDFEETDSQFTKEAQRRSSADRSLELQVKHQEPCHTEDNTDVSRQKPVPKKRTKLLKPQSSLSDSASSVSTQSVSSQSVSTQSMSTQSVSTTEGSGVRTPAPRGILKYSSSCSSSEFTVKNQLPEPVVTLSYVHKSSDQEKDLEGHTLQREPISKTQHKEPTKYPSPLKLPKSRLPVRAPSQLINPLQGTQEKTKIPTRLNLNSIPRADNDKKVEDSLKQKRTDDCLPQSPSVKPGCQKIPDETTEAFYFPHENAKSLSTNFVKPLKEINSQPIQQKSETMENYIAMFPKVETTRAEEKPSALNVVVTSNKANASTDIESSPSAFNIRQTNNVNQESKPAIVTDSHIHSPSDEQGNSITKVLEWFSRSTDSSDKLDAESNQDIEEDTKIDDIDFEDDADLKAKTRDNVYVIIPWQSKENLSEVNSLFLQETDWEKEVSIDEPPQSKPNQRRRSESMSQNESLIIKPYVDISNIVTQPEDIVSRKVMENDTFTRRDTKEEPKVKLETDFKVHQQKETIGVEENQRPKLANLRSFWERENIGPKILISRSNVPANNEPLIPSNVSTKPTEGVNDQRIPEDNLKVRSPKHLIKENVGDVSALECIGSANIIHNPRVSAVTKVSPLIYSNQKTDQILVNSPSDREVTSLSYLKSLPSLNSESLLAGQSVERIGGTDSITSSDGDCTSPKDSEPKSRPAPRPNPVPLVKTKSQQQENMAEKIKQLKSFWEKEKQEPRTSAQNIKSSMASTGKLNKRFTKSEFDLRSAGVEFDDDDDDDDTSERGRQSPNFSVYPLRKEKPTMTDCISTSQFKNLKDFWGGSHIKQSGPNSPVSKSGNQRPFGLPKNHSQTVDTSKETDLDSPEDATSNASIKILKIHSEKGNVKPLENESQPYTKQSLKSSPVKTEGTSHSSSKKKTTTRQESDLHVGETISHGVSYTNSNSKKDTMSKPATGQESQPQQNKSISKGRLNAKTKVMRRASSMFSVNTAVEEQSQGSHLQSNDPQSPNLQQVKKATERNLTSSKKTQESSYTLPKTYPENSSRENSQKKSSRTFEDSDFQPLARSYIPPDYQHYLGITEKRNMYTPPSVTEQMDDFLCTSFTTSSETSHRCKCFPVRTSTPVPGSPDLQTCRGILGLPSTTHIDGHDCHDASKTSTADNSSHAKRNLSCDNESSVHKALRRATSRPMYHKSMDNISTSPGQRQNIKTMDDSEQVPSTHVQTSFATSDPEHLKHLSKSVPSFLQKESDEGESDSENSSRSGMPQRNSRQYTDLSSYSGYSGSASLSSVSGSIASVYSGDYSSVEVQGTIQFSLNYVQKLREFHIFVVQCQNLAAVDVKRNRSDPYVKSYLIPDTSNLGKRKTAVKKKTLNPTYNEILRYRVRMEYLKSQVLNLSVWHNDTFGRNSFLGETELDLSLWDFNDTERKFLPLKPRSSTSFQPLGLRGQMRLAVRFLPQIYKAKSIPGTGEVHIWVKDCNNLPLIRRPSIDPYVKCFVLPDTSKKSRQKTRVLKKTTSPIFNHTMVYDGFRAEDLKEACVELAVWDRDRLANRLLGGLRLGMGTGKSYGVQVSWMDSTAEEVDLWRRMMESPSEWVEGVLPLRMLTTDNNTWK